MTRVMSVLRLSLHRDIEPDTGAATALALDGEGSTDGASPRAHVHHAVMIQGGGGGRVEADSVVDDIESDVAVVCGERDGDARRLAMLADVVQRFLGDVIGGQRTRV